MQTTVRDQIYLDNNSDNKPSAGDILRYTVYIYNMDTRPAVNVAFTIAPDSNTTLVNGSVTTSSGIVTSGNFAQQGKVQVSINSINAGDYVVITYRTAIKSALPPRLMKLSTQAIVSASNVIAQLSDDPDTFLTQDATETLLTNDTLIQFYNERTLLTDSDGDGTISPGDTIRYTARILNNSYFDLTNVVLSNTVDSAAVLDAPFTTTSQGTIISGSTTGDTRIQIRLGTITSGADAQVNYVVTIPSSINTTTNPTISDQPSISFVENRASRVTSTRQSDDPTTAILNDATVTTINTMSRLIVTKSVTLNTDIDGDNQIDPLDTLRYQVRIQNVGNASRLSNTLSDIPDTKTTLIVGSVQSSQGTVVFGNGTGHAAVYVVVGDINAQHEITVTYLARVNSNASGSISSQATVSAPGSADINSDNPHTVTRDDPTVATIGSSPTRVVLSSFSVVHRNKSHLIQWSTASEIDTWRFNVYRVNTNGTRTLVPQCKNILSKGSSTRGATYQCTDAVISSALYILEEVTRTGGTAQYQTRLTKTLASLSVVANNKTHIIQWSTHNEIDTQRFRVYRVNTNGTRTLVSACANVISTGSPTIGARYRCVDKVTTSTQYIIEEVSRTGGNTIFRTKLSKSDQAFPLPFDDSQSTANMR